MHIHLEKVGIAASLATLECRNPVSFYFHILISYRKAYQCLLINLKNESTTPDTNLVVVNQEEHPLVTHWDTNEYGKACKTHGEFQDNTPAERGLADLQRARTSCSGFFSTQTGQWSAAVM